MFLDRALAAANEAAEARLERALTELAELEPAFVSITYGAGGSTRDRTHELVVHLERSSASLRSRT